MLNVLAPKTFRQKPFDFQDHCHINHQMAAFILDKKEIVSLKARNYFKNIERASFFPEIGIVTTH
jgi:hypothetical protein